MSILVGADTRLIVQGITGREGGFHAGQMLSYGTNVVGGVTPRKGGQTALDGAVPVYDTCAQAVAATGANTSVIFVPAFAAPDAIMEAVDAGIETIFAITEHIPALDMIPVVAEVAARGARLVGPNCPGATTPGEAKVGIIPGSIHRPGRVGLVSRSGTLTYEVVQAMTDTRIGQSTCVGIGGDPINGSNFIDMLELFAADPDTDAVVLIGEIGGGAEEAAAEWKTPAHAGHADGRLHRRPHGASGSSHGPRRRHHQRLRWHRGGQDRRPRGSRHPRGRVTDPDPADAHRGRHPARLTLPAPAPSK